MEAEIKLWWYENIYVDCPSCKEENIYNRMSDFNSGIPISRRDDITCYDCWMLFSIKWDEVVSGKWKWFINELSIYEKQKEYRMYILSLCQGCEVFFRHAIQAKLMDENSLDLVAWKLWLFLLKDASFENLRKAFLLIYEKEKNNDNWNLKKMKEDKRVEYFKIIKATKVNEIRNKVIHSNAYRPNSEEIKTFNSLVSSITWLARYLDIKNHLEI